MPLKVYEKLNVKHEPSDIQIIHLDSLRVKFIGELKKVLIRMFANTKVHQTIDIIVVDIPDNYGILLCWYWSIALNGYFATNLSLLWIPYNGKMNHIKIDREMCMKHVVTYLNNPNGSIMFNNSILDNDSYETFFWNFTVETSSLTESNS
jgi:hypothetical protein